MEIKMKKYEDYIKARQKWVCVRARVQKRSTCRANGFPMVYPDVPTESSFTVK